MENILEFIGRWVKHDLELEHALSIQDLRLINLGFSHSEVMDMTLDARSSYLQLGSDVKALETYEEAILSVEAGTLSSGFLDNKSRKQLYGKWDKQIKDRTKGLDFDLTQFEKEFVRDTSGKKSTELGTASKDSPIKNSRSVNFSDKMAAIARYKQQQGG